MTRIRAREWARHAAALTVIGTVVLALGWFAVAVNQELYAHVAVLTRIQASSTAFYLGYAALGALFSWAWPALAATRWRPRAPRSTGDWLVVALALVGTAFLYQNAILSALGGGLHRPPSALAWVAGGLLGPFVEEWLFRGLLYEVIRATTPAHGSMSAIVAGSTFFGVWHLSFEGLGPEALRMAVVHSVFGMLMALLRARLDGLLPGAVLHALGNSLAVLTA